MARLAKVEASSMQPVISAPGSAWRRSSRSSVTRSPRWRAKATILDFMVYFMKGFEHQGMWKQSIEPNRALLSRSSRRSSEAASWGFSWICPAGSRRERMTVERPPFNPSNGSVTPRTWPAGRLASPFAREARSSLERPRQPHLGTPGYAFASRGCQVRTCRLAQRARRRSASASPMRSPNESGR